MTDIKEGKWIDDGSYPSNSIYVIVQYSGMWPRKGHGGIAELYAINNVWMNIPKGVKVDKWMFYPKFDSELWFKDGLLPEDGLVVIAHYKENYSEDISGVSDIYTYDGSWFNIPEYAEIDRWMYIPEYSPSDPEKTLPQYMRTSISPRKWVVK